MSRLTALLVAWLSVFPFSPSSAQEAPPADLAAAITSLGNLDYAVRTNAARTLRRVPEDRAVPALVEAVRKNPDEYVRFRALIVLTGFNDRGTPQLMRSLLADRNDRLREVVYAWFAAHPDPGMTQTILAAVQTEQAEFVRPALIRALAALGSDLQVQRVLLMEAGRGLDFFRSSVIEVLGDPGAKYAFDAIAAIARIDGPLQDDAVIALGRMKDPRAVAVLNGIAKPSPDVVVALYASQCLLAGECARNIMALTQAISRRGASPDDVRLAVAALTAVISARNDEALTALFSTLTGASDVVRDQIAIGIASVAVRDPEYLMTALAALPGDRRDVVEQAMQDGFAMLEDDFAEEEFFAAARTAYWKAGEGSPTRALMGSLIQKLEF